MIWKIGDRTNFFFVGGVGEIVHVFCIIFF